jgi:hypothetical protein
LRSSGGQYLFANIMAKWFNLEWLGSTPLTIHIV